MVVGPDWLESGEHPVIFTHYTLSSLYRMSQEIKHQVIGKSVGGNTLMSQDDGGEGEY